MVTTDASAAMEKAQAFAHRLVEFADCDACVKFFHERQINFDRPNEMGWSVLMSVCACGRDDLVGFVADQTLAVGCATNSNRTTVLHLTAMSKNARVMEELVGTAERKQKLQKIVDQPNAHGDTALMMACVAKNVVAVQLLLELGASLSVRNVSGLNALMCAARVGEDPRPGAPSIDEMMERSATILKLLLAHGADVNAVETAGGNTALHLAVLSENPDAVESLITNAPRLDITLRNAADNTAVDLSRRISGVASAQMEDLLNLKWAQYEEEAAQMNAKIEQELTELAVKEAEDAPDRKQTKKKSKKTKKKAKAENTSPVLANDDPAVSNDMQDDVISANNEQVKVSSPLSAQTEAGQQPNLTQTAQVVTGTDDRTFEDDEGSWQSVPPKKTRRKESTVENAKAPSKRVVKKVPRTPAADSKNGKKGAQAPSRTATPPQTTQQADSGLPNTVPTPPRAAWSNQPTSSSVKPPSSVSPRSQVASEEDEEHTTASNISYEVLNGSFQRTFPVAAELEIDVEKFLIASSVSDRELEPDDSLSISQVEALQEAHWQAYHYLNEKKMELTRVLEAQRVEAQFVLQQELMQLK
ncbi:hypothetical protein PRIC2_006578 [Phytophthora ramorum]